MLGTSSMCGVTIKHPRGGVLGGTAIEHDDRQARVVVQGRVVEGTRVEVTLRPPEGAPRLRAVAVVREAPPTPVRGNRYELLLEFARAPEPLLGEAQDGTRDSGEYTVGNFVREVSQEMDVSALREAAEGGRKPIGNIPGAAEPATASPSVDQEDSGGSPFRARTGAFLQVDPEFHGGMLAHVRYRRPDTFVYAWRTQLSRDRVWLSSTSAAAAGTTVRVMFLMPRQPTAFRASGSVVDEPPPEEALGVPGVWVKLDKLPTVTRSAFDSAIAMFAPEQAKRRRGGGFLSRLRRRA